MDITTTIDAIVYLSFALLAIYIIFSNTRSY